MLRLLTIALSAFLLFIIQPMISKIILPHFGGGSSIWITSLIFFQSLLLAGYAASHVIAHRVSHRFQAAAFIIIVFISILFIPLNLRFTETGLPPAAGILILLFFTVGPPYFLLSTTTPTVQHWMAQNPKIPHPNPYIQYAVSNAGSLGGLLSYPFFVEPNFPISQQIILWSGGFILYIIAFIGCLILYLRGRQNCTDKNQSDIQQKSSVTIHEKIRWVIYAMIPSSALMVFTHYITVDIVNLPLLWVLPLCIYLISFVICFLFPRVSRPAALRTIALILPVTVMIAVLWGDIKIEYVFKIIISLVCLFSICMFFHGNLEREKPQASDLTFFYLYLSLGGCIGGILTGIAAPLIFCSNFEFYLVLAASFYLMVSPHLSRTRQSLQRIFQYAAILLILITYINQEVILLWPFIYKTRSFYGSYTIREYTEKEMPGIAGKASVVRLLNMGTTIHGGQAKDVAGNLIPIAYYHENTGIGQAFKKLPELEKIGLVGLGTGILSLYGKTGQSFDFFEIDPEVVSIAESRFDILKSNPAKIRYIIGDARIKLREIPANTYDLIVLDAFSSDAVPTHLLTLEAVQEYLNILKYDGVIMFHISNRHVDLIPVLVCNARKLDLIIQTFENPTYIKPLQLSANWAALTRSRLKMDILTLNNPEWSIPGETEVCWTDDFSNIWSVMR